MSDVKRTDELQGDIVHEYDGIEEADNRLPTWWLITFYGSIVFALGYFFVYHVYDWLPTQDEAYAQEAAQAVDTTPVDESELVALSQDQDAIARGRDTFNGNCVACHGDRAQGLIGPNLTDEYWLHGGSPTEIHHTVTQGFTARGMPAWGPVLGRRPVEGVVAYILSLRGRNEQGGRPPEGEIYHEEPPAPPEASAPAAPPSGT